MKIKEVKAEISYNSRKEKTVSVYVETDKGKFMGSAPSGKSTGKYATLIYVGSVEKVVKLINKLSSKIIELEIDRFDDLKKVEKIISKKNVGANGMFALESALLKALAADKNKEVWELINPRARKFPFPVGNVIGGGLHTKGKKPDFQEFLIIPESENFFENVMLMNKSHEIIGKKLGLMKVRGNLNDEGAWGCSLSDEECLKFLNDVRKELMSQVGHQIDIGIDVAASGFYTGYLYNYKNPVKRLSKLKQLEFLSKIISDYDVYYVEDGFDEKDFDDFSLLMNKVKNRLIVGDDLTVSNIEKLKKAIKEKSVNSLIVKPNQNGSLIEIRDLILLAKKNKIKTVFSHRSGETNDNIIADLAFGFQTDFVKFGVKGKEREVKLNRMIEIEKIFQ